MTACKHPGSSSLRTKLSTDGEVLHRDVGEPTLMQRIRAGDYDAGQQLVTSNLRRVLNSHRCYANGVRIFDLLKAGKQGLVHALENFGTEEEDFPEYAATCIRSHVERVLNPSHRRSPERCPS